MKYITEEYLSMLCKNCNEPNCECSLDCTCAYMRKNGIELVITVPDNELNNE